MAGTCAAVSSKLRAFETLGFRPESAAQEALIKRAQEATGLRMADLLRRAVLIGLPSVVAEIKARQDQAVEEFHAALHEETKPPARPKHANPS